MFCASAASPGSAPRACSRPASSRVSSPPASASAHHRFQLRRITSLPCRRFPPLDLIFIPMPPGQPSDSPPARITRPLQPSVAFFSSGYLSGMPWSERLPQPRHPPCSKSMPARLALFPAAPASRAYQLPSPPPRERLPIPAHTATSMLPPLAVLPVPSPCPCS